MVAAQIPVYAGITDQALITLRSEGSTIYRHIKTCFYYMAVMDNYTFRTKTGTCTITTEQIILTREGVRGKAAQKIFGNSIGRALIIYSVLGVGSIVFGAFAVWDGDIIPAVYFFLIGAFLLWKVIQSRNYSAVPVISRSAVRDVQAYPPRPPATRGYFTVLFEDNGKMRKRLIALPGSMEHGNEEYPRAEAAMRASGLL